METGIAHLLEASIKLECGLEVTNRALLIYHHFMEAAVNAFYDEDLIAAATLHLAGRIHEEPIELDSLICVFYSIANQTCDVMNCEDVAYQLIKRGLAKLDYLILRHLEFTIQLKLAHQYLVPFLAMILERSKNLAEFCGELASTSIRFMNDFYTQQACLASAPEVIAIACIDLALYVHGLINDLAMVPAWYMGFACDVTPDMVKSLKQKIMKLYEKPFELIPRRRYIPTQDEEIMPIAEVQPLQALPQPMEV